MPLENYTGPPYIAGMTEIGTVGTHIGLRENSREVFCRLIDFVLEQFTGRQMIFAQYTSNLREKFPPVQRGHLFDITLSGQKQIIMADGGRRVKAELEPGDIFYTPPFCWKHPVWETPHEMSAFVFNPDFIRLTYIHIAEPMGPEGLPEVNHFYHTLFAPDKEMTGVLQTLQLLSVNGDAGNASPDLTRGLFRLLRARLEREAPTLFSKSQETYQRVLQYLRDSCHTPINREHVARVFRLHPGYLSRLFKENSGSSFHEVLVNLRMEQAAFLLKHSDFYIDEIADRCGYLSTSLFSAAFRRHFGLPPGRFRREANRTPEEQRGGSA